MPRIIFKCRYLKNASVHLSNMVEYVATREGVEKMPDSIGKLKNLKELGLMNNNFTEDELNRIQKMLPTSSDCVAAFRLFTRRCYE